MVSVGWDPRRSRQDWILDTLAGALRTRTGSLESLSLDYRTVRHHLLLLENNGLVTRPVGDAYGSPYELSPHVALHFNVVEEGPARPRDGPATAYHSHRRYVEAREHLTSWFMDASVVLGIVNIGLTAVLFSLYRHIYSQTRAVFSLGLLAFAGAFALQNVLVVYLVLRHNAADTDSLSPSSSGSESARRLD